jgi:hypothetical protein
MKRSATNGVVPAEANAIRPAADVRRGSGKAERTAKERASRAREAIVAFKNR